MPPSEASEERRQGDRRRKMVRNLFSYLNRRDLFKKGRRNDEWRYQEHADSFDAEQRRRSGDTPPQAVP